MTPSTDPPPEPGSTHDPDRRPRATVPLAGDDDALSQERWTLRLYVAGQTARSLRAVASLEKICSDQLQGRYRLEVVDLYQQPQLAQGEQIVAVPALIRRLPAPLRMLIGDMSDIDRVLIGLDLLPK